MFIHYVIFLLLSTSLLVCYSTRLIFILHRRDFNPTRSMRIRRENVFKDREHFNLYGTNDDDGKFFRNQPSDDLNEQKRLFDGEYYLSPKNQFRIRDLNELYDDDFFHGNRLSNEMNEYYPLWKKDRNRFGGKKSFENDFLDKQD